ncbi:MAG: glycerol-3-phosphate dehydrogenase [Lentibacter sp.]|uniref:glycerol-3-phosphate dehydrogenase n=1 Tax=Lentibacter sp. TaxID=2024994 RepID=UPI00260F9944|nr:glycerol-3-phosphate dehydrogenase [Lentibacter sp.]MDG1289822.1 glycerol-3-phosphate dehydrogenase [Lentibacter sp.]
MSETISDIFIIGGGVNGCGIARDAAGRGLSVTLVEQGDLASGTSSASTKLFHGGLRYLEYFEFRLVKEALKEREVLLGMMPHISWPMRFVLPLSKDMRFDAETPASRLLAGLMPWMKGWRPSWLIRLGLFFYDHMGGRKVLAATQALELVGAVEGDVLNARFERAFEYSDVWVDDARLVSLNARDAAERGARILTRARFVNAERIGGLWRITVALNGTQEQYLSRALVNAAGPWVAQALTYVSTDMRGQIRLVRGSHIVVPKLYDHDKCYFLQGEDGRICFLIPYEDDFTLIGTTDAEHGAADEKPEASAREQAYLIDFVNGYLRDKITTADIVWSYSGVRPLQDDGQASASAATRDYELRLERVDAALLTVFGGKITTYRKLSEAAVDLLAPASRPWTKGVALPGGNFKVADKHALEEQAAAKYPFLEARTVRRLVRSYGLDVFDILGDCKAVEDLGAGLSTAEVDWLVAREFAQSAEDILWRRSKLGLHMPAAGVAALEAYLGAL